MDQLLFWNFSLAIALGALIGIEREMPMTGSKVGGAHGFGGIRSYALISLFGAMATWLDIISGGHTWKIAGFAVSTLFIAIAYAYSSFKLNLFGTTSEYAALLTYIIGVVTMSGQRTIAIILAILLLIILSSKQTLTQWRSRLSRAELGSALKFAVISLVALPLLPDQRFSLLEILNFITNSQVSLVDPILNMKFINPFGIWFFVVVMAGVEYIGYILSKTLGHRGGAVLSGAIGGLVSSTATTAAMTAHSKTHPENNNAYIAATLVASLIMCIRVMLVSAFFNPRLLPTIAIPAIAMIIGLVGTAFYYYRKSQKETPVALQRVGDTEYESPFRLIPAIKFAMIVILVKFISGLGIIYKDSIPETIFYYVLGVISGLADVDAITMDMAGKSKEFLIPLAIAASTIIIATMSNNVVKASIAYRFGHRYFGRGVVIGFVITMVLGIMAILLVNRIH